MQVLHNEHPYLVFFANSSLLTVLALAEKTYSFKDMYNVVIHIYIYIHININTNENKSFHIWSWSWRGPLASREPHYCA